MHVYSLYNACYTLYNACLYFTDKSNHTYIHVHACNVSSQILDHVVIWHDGNGFVMCRQSSNDVGYVNGNVLLARPTVIGKDSY